MTTYIDANSSWSDARFVLLGFPYDGTTSYRPGARFGPTALRQASYGLENYSPYLNKCLSDVTIHDAGDLEFPMANLPRVMEMIGSAAQPVITANKIPISLGGEHLITLPVVQAMLKRNPDLHIIHFDAHCDLREDYLGDRLSHATVMRRILDHIPPTRLYQFGIRSGTQEEFEYARRHQVIYETHPDAAREVLKRIGSAPVYLTIDLDAFDPACMPGTGTPEPGGIDFHIFMSLLKVWAGRLNLVGADVVELAPMLDASGISAVLAAKVVRETILAFR